MAIVVRTMVVEHEWKMISCVGLTTGSLFPGQVLLGEGSAPTPGNPRFDLPAGCLAFSYCS